MEAITVQRAPLPRPTADRAVLGTLLRRELPDLVSGFRCAATALVIVLLMVLAAVVYSARYRSERAEHAATLARRAESLQGVSVDELAGMRLAVHKPPWKLAFLVDGEQGRTPDVYLRSLSPWESPELMSRQRGNERLVEAAPLDWLFVIRFVLSLAVFVLGYDALSGQRRTMLKVLLAYPIGRSRVLGTRLLALWLAASAPFLLGALLSLLVLTTYGGMRFDHAESQKIAVVLTLGLGAAFLYALIALLVSALCRESARSLVVLALVWITLVVVVPAAGGLLAHALAPLPTDLEVARQLSTIRQAVEAERGGPGSWRPPAWAESDGYALERASAATQNERAARQDSYRRELVARQLAQIEHARHLASPSLPLLIQDTAERLVGSGVVRDRAFVEQAWAYFDGLETQVARLDDADPASPHIHFFPGYLSTRPVDATSLPPFTFREPRLGEGLAAARRPGLLLLTATLLLAAALFFLFEQSDVG